MKNKERPIIIAGNWKMNYLPTDTTQMITQLVPLVKDAGAQVVLCVPYTNIPAAVAAAKGSNIAIGGQNCHWEESGAFTGEIAPSMLKDLGVTYVIVGHSERRQYFGETDESVNLRTKAAIKAGLQVIVCVGELLEQREAGITQEICGIQTKKALMGISKEQMKQVILAYEPVWAIGTGKTATAEEANEVNGHIRQVVETLYDGETAKALVVQYGGSMNPKNARELLEKEHIDGGLIGGASLIPQDFSQIVFPK